MPTEVNQIYWQEAAELSADEHERIAHEIVNEFTRIMRIGRSGGFMSTPPCLTVAQVHAQIATSLRLRDGVR